MAMIVKRIGKNGQLSYRAPVRREGGLHSAAHLQNFLTLGSRRLHASG
jgi:hypothetical protein